MNYPLRRRGTTQFSKVIGTKKVESNPRLISVGNCMVGASWAVANLCDALRQSRCRCPPTPLTRRCSGLLVIVSYNGYGRRNKDRDKAGYLDGPNRSEMSKRKTTSILVLVSPM